MIHFKTPMRQMVFVTGLMLCGFLSAQTVREEATLLDKPDGKPGNVKLAAGTSLKTLKRQGFWVEVDASGKTGWLKVSQINFAGATSGATAIDTGRLGTGNIVATSAARGLSAKDLVSGQPDFNEAAKLELLTAQPSAVQAFLTAGNVVAINQKIQLTVPQSSSPFFFADEEGPDACPVPAAGVAAEAGRGTVN